MPCTVIIDPIPYARTPNPIACLLKLNSWRCSSVSTMSVLGFRWSHWFYIIYCLRLPPFIWLKREYPHRKPIIWLFNIWVGSSRHIWILPRTNTNSMWSVFRILHSIQNYEQTNNNNCDQSDAAVNFLWRFLRFMVSGCDWLAHFNKKCTAIQNAHSLGLTIISSEFKFKCDKAEAILFLSTYIAWLQRFWLRRPSKVEKHQARHHSLWKCNYYS